MAYRSTEGPTTTGINAVPRFRLVVGLGEPERERRLLPALGECGDFTITERCLSADQLQASVEAGRADAVLVAADLHRMSAGTLAELARTGLPLVMLTPDPAAVSWHTFPGLVLPLEADAEHTRQALLAVIRGERSRPAPPTIELEPELDESNPAQSPLTALAVFTIVSGHGSPGRTTMAVNLATALGSVAPTILVDADLFGPSTAAHLDLDPTRNLYMLAHSQPSTRREWEHALAEETQLLGSRSPYGVALCGVPKPELRTSISVGFFERILAELRQRFHYVVVDVGADLLGAEAALHRAALGLCDHVLLVAATDLVGLWHARQVLDLLRTQLSVGGEKLALILNRHDRRYHHGRVEIEWALGVPAVAVIPQDHRAAQRALAAQRPLVVDGGGRAARALLDLAERVHDGRITIPPEPTVDGRARWKRWPSAFWPVRRPTPSTSGAVKDSLGAQGAEYGDDVASVP